MVANPIIAHRTDCVCASGDKSPNASLGRRFGLSKSHLHIANFIRNTLCAVACQSATVTKLESQISYTL